MFAIWLFALWLAAQTPRLDTVEQALARNQYRNAIQLLAELPASNARWHYLASKAWDGAGDPAKAVAEAEEALRLQPGNPAHHVQLAQIFLGRHTPKAALEILTEAESLFPDHFVIRLGKGLALKELQLYRDAERELLWCLSKQPSSPLPFDALATVYIQQGRFADARELAGTFLNHNPADYRGHYFLAAGREGETMPAEETLLLLRRSIDRNASFAAAYALLGKVLLRQEKTPEAVVALKRATQLRPDLVQAHLHLARALRSTGDETAAALEFETVRKLKAKEQEPFPTLLYHRGNSKR